MDVADLCNGDRRVKIRGQPGEWDFEPANPHVIELEHRSAKGQAGEQRWRRRTAAAVRNWRREGVSVCSLLIFAVSGRRARPSLLVVQMIPLISSARMTIGRISRCQMNAAPRTMAGTKAGDPTKRATRIDTNAASWNPMNSASSVRHTRARGRRARRRSPQVKKAMSPTIMKPSRPKKNIVQV